MDGGMTHLCDDRMPHREVESPIVCLLDISKAWRQFSQNR